MSSCEEDVANGKLKELGVWEEEMAEKMEVLESNLCFLEDAELGWWRTLVLRPMKKCSLVPQGKPPKVKHTHLLILDDVCQ